MTRSLTLLFALLTACGGDELVCTTEARASVTVTLTGPDGAAVADATGTWTSADASGDCEDVGDALVCGWEVAGDITVTLSAPGFLDAERTVTVPAGECHVEGQTLDVTLEADPGPICTDVVMPSVIVTVAGASGEALSDVAVTWHTTDATTETPCRDYDGARWACGDEEQGELTVTAVAGGHGEQSATVTVDADECHVITEEVTLTLDWLPD